MLTAVFIGMLVGSLVRAVMPGKPFMAFFTTLLLAVAGTVGGYLVFAELLGLGDGGYGWEFDLWGTIGSVLGITVALVAYDRVLMGAEGGTADGSEGRARR